MNSEHLESRDIARLATLLVDARPPREHLPSAWNYSKEILRIDERERTCIRLGAYEITPLSEMAVICQRLQQLPPEPNWTVD